jgi:hypothetical protein
VVPADPLPDPVLPSELVSVQQFARRHGLTRDAAWRKDVRSGALSVAPGGPWVAGYALVRYALDESGRRAFVRRYGKRRGFRACQQAECAVCQDVRQDEQSLRMLARG